ncbi:MULTISPECIES: sulfatase [unclassified Streptomyces]|uniref:sulfatase n=1 Tax=unclassified Streptomyces TaxID=2593676 RepID=UPI002DD8C947|nr:sulfatase [Streptomyces sp. NBC_01750]WSB04746.1 sulfatase [Streptomyces sp. NBC_01794]WSD30974.1 sulfatase [Streptomyces sp. NBC_01750]
MSLFTRAHQLPNPDKISAEEGPAPDDTAVGRDAAESDGTGGREDATTTGDATGDDPDEAVARGWRDKHPAAARAVSVVTTALAAVFVLFALLVPNELTRLTPSAFARIPVEGIFGAAVLLVLPPRARRVGAVLAGVGLGLVTILNLLDMGFYSVLDRPFDLVLDWILFDDAEAFLKDSVGPAGAIGAMIGVVLLVLAVLVLTTLAVVRLSRLMVRHSAVATRTTFALGTAWITCAALGVQIAAGVPLASRNTADLAQHRAQVLRAGIKDERAFAKEAAVDRFSDTPADQLLTGLRGKDVIFAFIESYGRSAVQDPAMASQVGAVLANGTSRLHAAGFASRSAFLTSPTFGGGSWLAHSTFMSGLWIKNQQRYRSVTSSDHLTLTGAFKRANAWRTVGIMPGVTRSWPEGKFYGLDNIYDSHELGYKGPKFSWAPVPDQYSLSAFERLEHGKPGPKPLMSEIILVSSHNPWAPIPKAIGWDEVGDGSVYKDINKEGKDPKEVWKDADQVRTEYRRSIEYSVNSLISYVEKYGNDNTVLVFLGDHQPAPIVTGPHASRDVPVAIVAHDPAVMDRISGWGWQDGLKPGPQAPVWRMDSFRDRFLTAYGPKPGPTPATPTP